MEPTKQVPLTMRLSDIQRLDFLVHDRAAGNRNELINKILQCVLEDVDRERRISEVPPVKYITTKLIHFLAQEMRDARSEGRG